MGRHSRKAPAPAAAAPAGPAPAPAPPAVPYPAAPGPFPGPAPEEPRTYGQPRGPRRAEPTVTHRGYVPLARSGSAARAGGHPEQRESGGAWGAGPQGRYGDWRGMPRQQAAAAVPAAGPWPALDTDTPAFGTPAVGFPRITLEPALPTPPPVTLPSPRAPEPDASTSTGSHRRVPAPRRPGDRAEVRPGDRAEVRAEDRAGERAEDRAGERAEDRAGERPAPGRGGKVRTYTGLAAVAVSTVVAVVVAGYVLSQRDGGASGTAAARDDGRPRAAGDPSVASRSDDRPTPEAPVPAPTATPAPELTYEQKMAQQLPVDAKLTGPGTFDTVPGVAAGPGKGKVVRYRVDVEQGLGMDQALFAEAVHRTLNDRRSWGHGGSMSFERVPGGETDFVITLASPGTTAAWCAKSGLDTTVDNVSCDSAATTRVMINAFRWAQGSATYGPDQMLAYRQMLINHEVGHRLGHGHVNCRTPGAPAPIMQQQTKSLDIDGVRCEPNPWVYPGG
ncbi:DUF3152 domain-containing protein [Streptomyces sp. NPDC002990]